LILDLFVENIKVSLMLAFYMIYLIKCIWKNVCMLFFIYFHLDPLYIYNMGKWYKESWFDK